MRDAIARVPDGTYYAEADEQLATLKALIDQVADNAFLAKLAVYSRQRAMMKDMPVALLLALSKRDPALFRKVFDRVVDNGRTLRTLVSGQLLPIYTNSAPNLYLFEPHTFLSAH